MQQAFSCHCAFVLHYNELHERDDSFPSPFFSWAHTHSHHIDNDYTYSRGASFILQFHYLSAHNAFSFSSSWNCYLFHPKVPRCMCQTLTTAHACSGSAACRAAPDRTSHQMVLAGSRKQRANRGVSRTCSCGQHGVRFHRSCTLWERVTSLVDVLNCNNMIATH